MGSEMCIRDSPSNEKVSLINDLPESFSGLGLVFFLLPNIFVFQQIIPDFATNKNDYFGSKFISRVVLR